MAITTAKSAFRAGLRDSAPFILVIVPFATLFGALATEAGLAVTQTLAFSVVVIAGAAQFTALQLMQEQASTVIVLLSALAVNLRMVMYSASLTPYLGAAPMWQKALVAYFTVDQTYACAIARYEAEPGLSLRMRMAYFVGAACLVAPLWYGFTLVGALIGARIPDSWAIDFALPITFLAMVAPMLRTPAHRVAALVAIAVSLMAAALPYSLGLIAAGLCGMMAGARTELWQSRRMARA